MKRTKILIWVVVLAFALILVAVYFGARQATDMEPSGADQGTTQTG